MRSPSVGASSQSRLELRDLTRPLWCRVMGEFALYPHRDAETPVITAGKPLALLAYLALSPDQKVDRDRLGELLWPTASPQERRHSLRQSRYRLRSATGGSPIVIPCGDTLALAPIVQFDCLEGEAARDSEMVYRLLRGGFLPGFSIPESHEFEEWADTQRARFGSRWASAALEVAASALESGDPDRALTIAEENAAARPFDDEPVRMVMRSLVSTGRIATALSRYAAYEDLLATQEYRPDSMLTEYAEELSALARQRSAEPRREMPFVGRASEWATLERLWTDAARGRGGVALIEGGAGLGKSRLLREIQTRARAAEGLVLAAKCYEPEITVPFAAVTDALTPAVARPATAALAPSWLAELAKLLPEIRELDVEVPTAIPGRASPAAKRRLHHAVLRLLSAISADAPVLLAIDDVQWADPASLEVLHFLARKADRGNVLILVTYRPAELTPEARRLTRSLTSGRLAELLALEPLRKEDVADLLRRAGAFDSPAAADAVTGQLQRVSGGNPLFLEELLDALERERILFVQNGRWVWGGAQNERQLPRTIGKLLADRIEVLDTGTRACLELAAVVADNLSSDTLAEALALSGPRTDVALLILEDNRLIRRLETGDFAIAHDELRRMVYQMIPDDRRRTLHESVARVLESRGEAKRPGGSARLAYHFEQGSVRRKARHYALEAAREASSLSAVGEGRAQRRIAAALAERPLAPGEEEDEGAGPRWLRGSVTATVVLSLLVLGTLGGVLIWPSRSDPGYHQGTLFLSSAQGGRKARVVWTANGGEVRQIAGSLSGGRPELFVRPVSDGGETHNKVFIVREGDTTQLTEGRSDDNYPTWAPDGASIFLLRGWKAASSEYPVNVFRLDPVGKIQGRVTQTAGQDATLAVSPLGTALAVARDSGGLSSIVLMDIDGENRWNLTDHFALPRVRSIPAFAPDGGRIALAFHAGPGATSDLYVVNLRAGHARKLFTASRTEVTPRLTWSPDGRWIAIMRRQAGRQVLTILPADGAGEPMDIDANGPGLYPGPWEPSHAYVDRVEISPPTLALQVGDGSTVDVDVVGSDGNVLPAERIRFAVLDTSIARVDDRGHVVGRAPGSTALIATAGGFRADTVNVSVTFAEVDTLFVETWRGGLDTTVWKPFGSPSPMVLDSGVPGYAAAFLNNGDYNHGSGVVSEVTFDAADTGLTIEVDGWIPLKYAHWQHWQLGIIAGDPNYFGDHELSQLTAAVHIAGDIPVAGHPVWICHGGLEGSSERSEWVPKDRWVKFGLQIRPDGRVECFEDGQLMAAVDLADTVPLSRLAIALRGHSVGTRILHGPIVVTRGYRY